MTPFEKALQQIQLRLKALNALRERIEGWQEDGTLDFGYAGLKLNELESRESDLGREMDELIETQEVTHEPSAEEIEALANAVDRLRNHVIAASAARGIIIETFTLIGIATGH